MKSGYSGATVSLSGLFVDDEESSCEGQQSIEQFNNELETVNVNVGDISLKIRQMSWHMANANQIWPGTFRLAEHIFTTRFQSPISRYSDGKILELGSATGALAVSLLKHGGFDVITSDINDGGIVEENIAFNFQLNEVNPVQHIAHTWGDTLPEEALNIKYIFASDILLYVKAYSALVQTLQALFERENNLLEFLMAWNRRIEESKIFFEKMQEAGFQCFNHGKGIYSFYLSSRLDPYLQSLQSMCKTK